MADKRDKLIRNFVNNNRDTRYPSGTTKPPGAKGRGGWALTPDQRDRNSDWSRRRSMRRGQRV